jgi:glutaredoxin-related protein
VPVTLAVLCLSTDPANHVPAAVRDVQILQTLNVPFESVNILEDEMLRSGMKEFSQWPTFPQVYINGEFYGGCDIMIGEPLSQHCHRITQLCFGRPPSQLTSGSSPAQFTISFGKLQSGNKPCI